LTESEVTVIVMVGHCRGICTDAPRDTWQWRNTCPKTRDCGSAGVVCCSYLHRTPEKGGGRATSMQGTACKPILYRRGMRRQAALPGVFLSLPFPGPVSRDRYTKAGAELLRILGYFGDAGEGKCRGSTLVDESRPSRLGHAVATRGGVTPKFAAKVFAGSAGRPC
jgi:hypothetical protein